MEVAARARGLGGLAFFDTAGEGNPARLSIIAAAPVAVLRGNLWRDAAMLRDAIEARRGGASVDDGMPHGMIAGVVEYDGTFEFGVFEETLAYEHATGRWHEHGELWARILRGAGPVRAAGQAVEAPRFAGTMASEQFCRMVERAQEYIGRGDIYQVNLSHRFEAEWSGDSWAFYEALRHYSAAPQAAFVELGERAILSASPETFLQISGRRITTRPIKGTRPRRADPGADERSAYDLITSPKEISELVMITDLERNDLGQVCEYGTVQVRELLKLERFEQVFHLVSTVEGRLRPEVDHVSALAACFPGGSITGAPKRRAREIIEELEPVERGVYTGAIGWLGFNGESAFNIAIRTVVCEGGRARFHVGAGIVADSVPAAEWQETLDKAAGIFLAAERFAGRGG